LGIGQAEVKFIPEQAIKPQTGNRGIAVLFLCPQHEIGVGGQLHTLDALSLGRRPGTHCTGGWVGPMAGLDECRKCHTHWDLITRSSSPQQVTVLTMLGDWAGEKLNSP
jgi:hypothetical protein